MIIAHAEFDMDINCVWTRTSEGNIVIVDCDAFEMAYADGMYQRSELHWLIYNALRKCWLWSTIRSLHGSACRR